MSAIRGLIPMGIRSLRHISSNPIRLQLVDTNRTKIINLSVLNGSMEIIFILFYSILFVQIAHYTNTIPHSNKCIPSDNRGNPLKLVTEFDMSLQFYFYCWRSILPSSVGFIPKYYQHNIYDLYWYNIAYADSYY